MKKILVSAISYVNHRKNGSEIYTTFANRLINDVLTKTPWDVCMNTNAPEFFTEAQTNNPERVLIRENKLENHKTHVGAFNQLLKFSAIKDIDPKYDFVLYLDCDAGFTEPINIEQVESKIDEWVNQGYDMLALRTEATYDYAEFEYNRTINENGEKGLFHPKFNFYGVHPEWRGAKLPSEHIFLVRNDEKLSIMANEFEKFCTWFETQDENYPTTWDMEAFEIGVSAHLAGYNMGEMHWGIQCEVFKVGFNANNWEKIKI